MQQLARGMSIAVLVATAVLALGETATPRAAARCSADVENVGARLVGNRFFTQWRVQHDAGNERLATVFFEYKINYVNKRHTTLVERGVFRELLRGQGRMFTKEDISLNDPVDIISVDFDRISCTD